MIACPAAGYTEVALGARVNVAVGDWFFIAASVTTAAFYGINAPVRGGNQWSGRWAKLDGVWPPVPAVVTGAFAESGPVLFLVGVA